MVLGSGGKQFLYAIVTKNLLKVSKFDNMAEIIAAGFIDKFDLWPTIFYTTIRESLEGWDYEYISVEDIVNKTKEVKNGILHMIPYTINNIYKDVYTIDIHNWEEKSDAGKCLKRFYRQIFYNKTYWENSAYYKESEEFKHLIDNITK